MKRATDTILLQQWRYGFSLCQLCDCSDSSIIRFFFFPYYSRTCLRKCDTPSRTRPLLTWKNFNALFGCYHQLDFLETNYPSCAEKWVNLSWWTNQLHNTKINVISTVISQSWLYTYCSPWKYGTSTDGRRLRCLLASKNFETTP